MQIAPRVTDSKYRNAAIIAMLACALFTTTSGARAQVVQEHVGEVVPRDVREMYDRGLQYLVKTQSENGDWTSSGGFTPRRLSGAIASSAMGMRC